MKADYTFDFRGSITSITLLKVTQTVMQMAPNEIMEIQGFDPTTKQDLFRLLPASAYELLTETADKHDDSDECYRIFLKKCASKTG